MTGRVTVDEQIYERQGVKIVLGVDGRPRLVPRGQLPEPSEEIVGLEGEPAFQVRLTKAVHSDDDVPDEVGLALRRVAQRLYEVTADGREVPGEQGPVEWIVGPAVHDGVVVLYADTDGNGLGPAMIERMVDIFVEELEPLAVRADISAAPTFPSEIPRAWMSSDERGTE